MDGTMTPTRTMRAAVVTGPGELRIEEVARPEPGPGQIRVRLEGCGVCASNLTPFNRRGRVALVATTAPRHGNRRIHPGTRVSALARAYPRRRAAARRVLRAYPRSPRLFGIRRGRVRFVAVSSPRVIRNRPRLRSYLRHSGVMPRPTRRPSTPTRTPGP